jgi:hypothetical protein
VTAPIVTEDMSTFEFDLACEAENCDKSAVVMCKACGDLRYFAICRGHLNYARRWFESHRAVVCSICHRPWLHFETHYDVQDI